MPGEEGGDMRFLLPGGPSPAALAALLSACRELDRAGAPHMLVLLHLHAQWGTLYATDFLWDRLVESKAPQSNAPRSNTI